MKITLIRPSIVVPRWNQATLLTPPLGLAYVAGSLKAAGHDVIVVDGVGEAPDSMHPTVDDCFIYGLRADEIAARVPDDTQLIGVSAGFTFEWPMARDLVGILRQRFPHAVIVCGGEHVTAMPEFSLDDSELDAVLLGEGEETAVELADRLSMGHEPLKDLAGVMYKAADGSICNNGRRARMRGIDEISWPAWDLLPIENYLDRELGFGVNRGRSMPLLASRGCPYQCTFCSSPQMWTTRWIARSIDKLLDEMVFYQERYGATNFDFYDLTAVVKKAWIKEFCETVIARGLRFTWQLPSGTRSEAIDEEVAVLLYQSGCRNLSYAPESGSPSVLRRIKKKIEPDRMLQSIHGSVAAGINVKCNLILGFPGETYREVAQTLGFIARLAWAGAHDLSIWAFSPYPGSELFDDLESQGKISWDRGYFDRLRSYADASRTVSYSEHISDSALRRLRLLALVLFYVVSWATRPIRPIAMIIRVYNGRVESRSEMVLRAMLRRWRAT